LRRRGRILRRPGRRGRDVLQGSQETDTEGVADFRTIFPGWYTGRAVHIHVKVSPDGDQTHTGQLFFDPAVTSAVYTREPYAVRGEADTPNRSDGIYAESGSVTVVAVIVSESSAAGSVTLGVQRT
jgi:protocatechuate 3,4-dioxygenase beta subunit